jgi:hypothetical protein
VESLQRGQLIVKSIQRFCGMVRFKFVAWLISRTHVLSGPRSDGLGAEHDWHDL